MRWKKVSKALKEKSLYPIFTEQNFRDFVTKDKESVWECQVASTYSSDRFDEVAILKLAVKDAKAIRLLSSDTIRIFTQLIALADLIII